MPKPLVLASWLLSTSAGLSWIGSTAQLLGPQRSMEPRPGSQASTKVWTEEARLAASDGQWGDAFGHALVIRGDTAFIGAPGDDHGCPNNASCNHGSVYVFERSGTPWMERAKLVSTESKPGDEFGHSLDASDETLLVGAPRRRTGGAVYVYTRSGTTWVETQRLLPSDGSRSTFGWSVAIDGDMAVIGNPNLNSSHGGIYVFERRGGLWVEQQRITLPGRNPDKFGHSVGLAGNLVVAGAPLDGPESWDSSHWAGVARVFVGREVPRTELAELLPKKTPIGTQFGWSIDVDGDWIAVGSFWEEAIYLFQLSDDTWSPRVVLQYPGTGFGRSLDLQASRLVVGASDRSMAVVFELRGSSWQEAQWIETTDPTARIFGDSVSLDGDTILVGDRTARPFQENAGAAYVFR